ncbi:spondin domain-containing protein [Halorarius litoreus]|uniref:spondin domain-containing protein n=1 Tax=Halorarius litoreus TaxID=2962676 RepID=UPI0020CF0D5B|nr:spondin domain-containing protein [Halorarius litoreus]
MTAGDGLPMNRRTALGLGGATLGGLTLGSGWTAAQEGGENGEGENGEGENGNGGDGGGGARRYRVTVANLTTGQPFTPPAAAAHRPSVEVFSVGDPANEPTQQLAENGNLTPLVGLIEETDAIRAAAVGNAPLVPQADPGETGNPYFTTLELDSDASATHLTVVAMLIATNDGIVGLDTVPLPQAVNASRTYYANGYDVGTEENTELFEDLVPPAQSLIQGGEPDGGTTESDPDLAEDGVITPHPGIQGVGDLDPEVYGWDEPAALVQVERLE